MSILFKMMAFRKHDLLYLLFITLALASFLIVIISLKKTTETKTRAEGEVTGIVDLSKTIISVWPTKVGQSADIKIFLRNSDERAVANQKVAVKSNLGGVTPEKAQTNKVGLAEFSFTPSEKASLELTAVDPTNSKPLSNVFKIQIAD